MKNKFILLLFLSTHLLASTLLDEGDKYFLKKHYEKALLYYLQTDKETQKKIQPRIIQSYLQTGDKYSKIKLYKKALKWYGKAAKLKNPSAITKIGQTYEKKADRYTKNHKYDKALVYYQKAFEYQNKLLNQKIEQIKKKLSHKKNLENDTRILVTKDSPSWTHTIGRLIIPTKSEFISKTKIKTKTQKCSATLINLDENKDSKVIITASHCLGNHDPKAGQIKFTIKNKNGKTIIRTTKLRFDSKFDIKKMKTTTDFAVLSLNKAISNEDVKPLVIRRYSFDTLQQIHQDNFGSLGGFSNDIAGYGNMLTYDPKCKLKPYSKMYGSSTCKGFKGASGGPIILTTTNSNKTKNYHFVGVVSHFRDQKFTNIYFAPHHLFYHKIKKIIESV
ncbi:trypsin-like serine protease [Arcobacteraceae bacterium]|nr:trypsin-like serine protease [Arcobacteraceae bacterium]